MPHGTVFAGSRAAKGAPPALWLLGALLLAGACTSPNRAYGPPTSSSSGSGSGGAAGSTGNTTGGRGGEAVATVGTASTGSGTSSTPVGSACSGDGDCTSSACVDGVCCASSCTGACMACSGALTGAPDGTCSAVTKGTDPHSSCNDDGATSCTHDGSCDGQGACELYAAGTQCTPPSCAGGTRTLAGTCDGTGTCTNNGTQSCGAYACMGDVCANQCAGDSSCAMGQFCNSTGNCVAQNADGAACGGADQCTSGFCVDGVCCNTACGSTCKACSAAKKGAGADGACGNIAAGGNPDNECAATSATTCGTDGACDGSGACHLFAMGTPCAAASCSGSTLKAASTCNGSGTCVPGATSSCGAYECGAGACKTSCAADTDCVSGEYCLEGACGPKRPLAAACASAADCTSGFCSGGVCCNTACLGICQTCDGSSSVGQAGTCSFYSLDDCQPCGGNKICSGSGTCTASFCP